MLYYINLFGHVDEAHAVVVPVRHGDGAVVVGERHTKRGVERGRGADAVGEGGLAAAGERRHGPRRDGDEPYEVGRQTRHGDGVAVPGVRHAKRVIERGRVADAVDVALLAAAGERRHGICRHGDELYLVIIRVRHGDGAAGAGAVRGERHAKRLVELADAAFCHRGLFLHVDEAYKAVVLVRHGNAAFGSGAVR